MKFFKGWFSVVFLLGLILMGCFSNNSDHTKPSKPDSVVIAEKPQEVEKPKDIEVNYHYVITAEKLDWLKNLSDGDTLDILLYLNRVDKEHLIRLDTLIFPDTIFSNLSGYCSFPKFVPILDSVKKMILVSYFTQEFAVYENGHRIRYGPVSLGKETTQTPKGLYFTNWKSKKTHSTVDPSWILPWCFNFANFEGVSLHEYALPGYPASHACVRLLQKDAYWFYYWADQWRLTEEGQIKAYGTPILIFGDYPFQARRPWLNLAENNKALQITEEMLEVEMKELLPTILERQKVQQRIHLEEKEMVN